MTAYSLSPTILRLASHETHPAPTGPDVADVDWHSLRALADNLADTPAPLRVVAPAELPVCEDCSADTDWSPSPTVAEVAYRGAGGASWRVPVCELHVRPTVRWLLAHTATADVQVLIPAPTVPLSPPAPVLALPQPSSAVELGVSA